nr:hypothetical protein [uncultured Capnocytophaga sp.]
MPVRLRTSPLLAQACSLCLVFTRTGNYSYNTLKEKNCQGRLAPRVASHLVPSENYF